MELAALSAALAVALRVDVATAAFPADFKLWLDNALEDFHRGEDAVAVVAMLIGGE